MNRPTRVALVACFCVLGSSFLRPACGLDIVCDGKPVAVIVIESGNSQPAAGRDKSRGPNSDLEAAGVLVDWVRKMTDAELPIATSADAHDPAIFIGAAAVQAGENTVAVRVDHTQITELFLGGIVRPVVVIEKAR